MSGMIWDAEKESNLLSTIDTLDTEHGDIAKSIEDIGNGGEESLSTDDQNKKVELLAKMKVTESKLNVKQAELTRLRLFKPEAKLPGAERNEHAEELAAMIKSKDKDKASMEVDIETISSWMSHREMPMMAQRSDVSSGDGAAAALKSVSTTPSLVQSLKAFGAGLEVVNLFTTSDGNTIKFPVQDTTAQEGEMLANEGSTIGVTEESGISDIDFPVQRFTSRFIPISHTLIQDSVIDVVSLAMMHVGRRLGRAISKKIINGTAADGIDGIANFAPAYALSRTAYSVVNDTVGMEHTPDRAYLGSGEQGLGSNLTAGAGLTRNMGYQGFIVSYSMLKILRTALDGDNRPLWQPSMVAGAPGTILGQPVKVVDELDDYSNSANSTPICFGNFDYVQGRFAKSITVNRLTDSVTMQTDHTTLVGIARYGQKMTIKAGADGKNPAIVAGVTSKA